MGYKFLKIFCVATYAALLVVLILMVFQLNTEPKLSRSVSVHNAQPGYNNTVQIVGNNNIVNLNVNLPENRTNSIDTYAERIIAIRRTNRDFNFSWYDAMSLIEKIETHAVNNGLTLENGLVIVNVESDFKSNAYNKKGKAYGLTQATLSCLNEFNWYNNTEYTEEDLYDVDINLEVGFWYYNRILTHYADYYGYISSSSNEKALKDAYICYNIGIKKFSDIGSSGRNELRNGVYPCDMYGSKKGDTYEPVKRFTEKMTIWN